MPLELQIIRAQEFVRMGAHGHFDLKVSKAMLAELARACCKRGIKQALLDLRALHPGPKPVFSPNDLVTLVNTFREVGFTHKQRVAVLYGSDPHHRARLFSFIATLRGWKVQAFDSYEQAITWLSGGDAPPAENELQPRAEKSSGAQTPAADGGGFRSAAENNHLEFARRRPAPRPGGSKPPRHFIRRPRRHDGCRRRS